MATAVLSPVDISAKHRIPTLDGWRGVAILLVLFDHLQQQFLSGGHVRPWTATGQHGVTIFFVLSGFLITSKLSEGPIDLKRFYIRRLFRLMPAAWTFLAVMLLFNWLTGSHFITSREVWACLLFYRNFVGPHVGKIVGVTWYFWSLSLEEQFYLVWPPLLLFAGIRRSRWIAALGAVACACWRWTFWAHYNHPFVNSETQVRADALLVGCLLALLFVDSRFRAFAAQLTKLIIWPAAVVLVLCVARFDLLPPLVENVSIAILISAGLLYPNSFLAKAVALPPIAWLGTISYSLYVWQALFFTWRVAPGLRSMIGVCVLLFALGSHYLIEKPLIQWGRKLEHLMASRRA
jgi:peptidoglycan/LPS O-acetylase OafA/YrhL